MLKRGAISLLGLVGLGLLVGCAGIPGTPVPGLLYLDAYGPGDAEGEIGSKAGMACARSVLGLVGFGDASIQTAAKAGRVTRVTSVDTYHKNILGLLSESCTIVRGE